MINMKINDENYKGLLLLSLFTKVFFIFYSDLLICVFSLIKPFLCLLALKGPKANVKQCVLLIDQSFYVMQCNDIVLSILTYLEK